MKKIQDNHFEGGKNLNEGHKHAGGPSLPNLINELHDQKNYSTQELDTGGKWVDGKTIFRKAFIVPAQVNNNQNIQALGFTLESLVRVGGFVNDGPNILMLPVPIPNNSTSVVGIAITTSGTILQIHTGDNGAHDGGFVWIEYTKV